MAQFLTARWESLLMASYACPTELLARYVPEGVTLDEFRGEALVSVVGFRFLQTRVRGCKVPGHVDFDEVNLRFYVRREDSEELRRGVVFIKELVPKPMISAIAQRVYGEPYQTAQMSSVVDLDEATGGTVRYGFAGCEMSAVCAGAAAPSAPGSHEEFVNEHYWGYTKRANGTSEYRVEHPRWKVWACSEWAVSAGLASLYGEEFRQVLESEPKSVLVATGSEVSVHPAGYLKASIL